MTDPSTTPGAPWVRRADWVHRMLASNLTPSTKLTLHLHSMRGPGAHHDNRTNVHSRSQPVLASILHTPERTIQHHMRMAVNAGWLLLHQPAYTGKQAGYHYTLPGTSGPCPKCRSGDPNRGKA